MIYRLMYKLLHDSADIRHRVATRIFAEHAPASTQGACIIIRHISGTAIDAVENETGLADNTIQIDFYDENITKCESGYQLIRNRLSGYRGDVDILDERGEEETITVTGINLLRPGGLVESPQDSSDKWTCRYSADFQVFHTQDVPTHV